MLSLIKRVFGGERPDDIPGRRGSRGAAAHPAGAGRAKSKPPLVDALDNPDLKIDAPQDPGFDPYNTGTFNRSGSWERINKRRNS